MILSHFEVFRHVIKKTALIQHLKRSCTDFTVVYVLIFWQNGHKLTGRTCGEVYSKCWQCRTAHATAPIKEINMPSLIFTTECAYHSPSHNTSLDRVMNPLALFTLWFTEMKTFSSIRLAEFSVQRLSACDNQPWIANMIISCTRGIVKLQLVINIVTRLLHDASHEQRFDVCACSDRRDVCKHVLSPASTLCDSYSYSKSVF